MVFCSTDALTKTRFCGISTIGKPISYQVVLLTLVLLLNALSLSVVTIVMSQTDETARTIESHFWISFYKGLHVSSMLPTPRVNDNVKHKW